MTTQSNALIDNNLQDIIQWDRHFERNLCGDIGTFTLENIRGNNNQRAYPNQDRGCAVTVRAFFNPLENISLIDVATSRFSENRQTVPAIGVIGVFDGHGAQGDIISSLVRGAVIDHLKSFDNCCYSKMVYHDFINLNQFIQKFLSKNPAAQLSGTTACFCVLEGPLSSTQTISLEPNQAVTDQEKHSGVRQVSCTVYRGVIINTGDSRALIIRNKEVVFSTTDHKPTTSTEKSRIERAGGYVHHGYAYGSNGHGFALSRSLGDVKAHENGILSFLPDIYSFGVPTRCSNELLQVKEKVNYFFPGDILVFATDGLWDVMSNEEVSSYICTQLSANKDLQTISEELAYKARKGNVISQQISRDDITIVIAQL